MNSDSEAFAKYDMFLMCGILIVFMFLLYYSEHVKNNQFSDCVNNAIEHNTNVTKCKILLER